VSDPWLSGPDPEDAEPDDVDDQAAVDTENDRRAERDEELEMRAATAPTDDTPPVCGSCGDRDPFCCDGQARAAEEQPEPCIIPAEGDLIEVPVGAHWLPATVTRAAMHGPGTIEGWYSGMIHFKLVGADYIGGCTYAVADNEFKRASWRWPARRAQVAEVEARP
jgi:hypothetical protein